MVSGVYMAYALGSTIQLITTKLDLSPVPTVTLPYLTAVRGQDVFTPNVRTTTSASSRCGLCGASSLSRPTIASGTPISLGLPTRPVWISQVLYTNKETVHLVS